MTHQPSLFDNPPPPDANDPYQSRREPPQVLARREGLRVAEPMQGAFVGFVMGGLHGQPDGWDGDDVADYVSMNRGIQTERGSVCAVLKNLVDKGKIWVKPERRKGRRGVAVTVYMHNRFAKESGK